MPKFDEFDQYSEDMLMAQCDISEIISHELSKGEVREDFLISTLEACSEPKPIFIKGTLSDGNNDAGQLDIVLCRPYSHLRRLGNQCYVRKSDALCVIEVKGNCTGRDLQRAESKALAIRRLRGEQGPLYGVVSYKVSLEEKTVMKRFGYSHDRETNTYYDKATLPNEPEVNWDNFEYPNLDFFVSLEMGKKIFLRKYEVKPNKERYFRSASNPLIKDLFSMVRSLWIQANATSVSQTS